VFISSHYLLALLQTMMRVGSGRPVEVCRLPPSSWILLLCFQCFHSSPDIQQPMWIILDILRSSLHVAGIWLPFATGGAGIYGCQPIFHSASQQAPSSKAKKKNAHLKDSRIHCGAPASSCIDLWISAHCPMLYVRCTAVLSVYC
jgi:hypothetical protein